MISNFLWKYGGTIWAIQTEDKTIANKIKRRGFSLFNYGWNCDFWVFHFSKRNKRDAINTFKALTGKDAKYNSKDDVWECI